MSTTRTRRTGAVFVSLVAAGGGLWLAGAREAAGDPVDDGVPSGTVAFFHGGVCPSGWVVADTAQGRLLVGVADGNKVGVTVHTPLGDREDRAHHHAFSGKVSLPDKVIAAADGPNQNGAAAMTYDVTGNTDAQTSGLPFVQVQACKKP